MLGKETGDNVSGGEEEKEGTHEHLWDERDSPMQTVGAKESRGELAA